MATIQIADKPTLDSVNTTANTVNTNIGTSSDTGGSESTGTVMGKLNALILDGEWKFIVGDKLIAELNNEAISTAGVGENFYPHKITAGMGGTFTVKGTLSRTGSGSGTLNVYVNNTAVISNSSSGTSDVECSATVSFSKGDEIKISVASSSGDSSSAYSKLNKNTLKIYGDVMPKSVIDALAFSDIS